ncbi:MAG: OmpA family protein [Succinivibrionaceae bacterium]|nr:OmpA family protein [Ruminobacter sp.]MDY5778646.1 OmpA family protein [Succinivibrionaceae bacterium]MEE1340460.1 OmpA family protein [Succinivibrionaceae bacterium]
MKKTLLSILAVSCLFGASSLYAAESGTGYVGGRIGLGHTETQLRNRVAGLDLDENNSFIGGLYAGYNFTNFLGLELGYDYLGAYSYKDKVNTYDYKIHGGQLAALVGIPFNKTDDLYFKLGALVSTVKDDTYDGSATKTTPLLGLGTRVYFGDLGFRLEYQYAPNVVDKKDFGYEPDLHTVTLGVEYKFGSAAEPAPEPAPAPVVEPEKKIVEHNVVLDSSALFGFGKSTLTTEAKDVLNTFSKDVNSSNLKDVKVEVAGYTDRIGSDKSNKELSQKRADAVADELRSNGLNASISSVGYGEENPVTGNNCDNVKGKKNLVNCLAPDRRVEIKVSGTQATEE